MANSNSRGAQPSAAYEDLRFADGSHTGVRVDRRRLLIEVQRRGRREYFDLALIIDLQEQPCYTDEQITAGA